MANPLLVAAQKQMGVSRKRMYAAGARFDRTTDWIMSAASIDQEIRSDLRILRKRSRMLVRDNPHARGVVRYFANNVIGAHGIRPIPMNYGVDGELSKKANAAIVRAWLQWSKPKTASTDERSSFAELERQLTKNLVMDGEFLIRKWVGFDNAWGYALEIIDPDLLDEQFNRGPDRNGNEIRMGVEVDRFHRPVAYHLFKYHPSEVGRTNERVPVPASEIIHGFIPLRPGQTRGIPWFACILLDAQMLAGYTEAELVAARTAAAKMGFFVSDKDDDATDPPQTGEQISMEASPGLLEKLTPGTRFETWDPQHPNAGYDAFTRAILRAHAVGMGVSYASLTGDLSQTSFSSSRVGMMGERDEFEVLQTWLVEHSHADVYTSWLPLTMLTPFLTLPSFDAKRWLEVRWQGRRWQPVDPLKDITAIEKEIALGVNSRSAHCRSMGREFEGVLQELAHENELAKQYKVDITGATVTVKEDAPGNDAEDEPDNGKDDTPESTDKPARMLRTA